MKKKYGISLYIFRRDLRLEDNTGLHQALKDAQTVIPLFVFDERQVTSANSYRSKNALLFMMESIATLNEALGKHKSQLYLFYGNPSAVVETICKKINIDALFVNKDYTPFSIQRDHDLAAVCEKHNIIFEQHNDLLLTEPENILTKEAKPYKIFTPFFKCASNILVRTPMTHLPQGAFYTQPIQHTASQKELLSILDGYTNKQLHTHGGSSQAHKLLGLLDQQKMYLKTRDIPSLHTTGLSAHLKFGTISVRAVFYAITKKLGSHHPLLRQLYWRDFLTHTLFHFPQMLGGSLQEKYHDLAWNNDKKLFAHWCEGTTGFPIVDAGMRQLNATGFMHNRVRMVVASFLVKDLHIDWRWGEQYFAQKLIDYDPAVNNGNWQWCASTGFDAQPYFRIFNPWLQQKKFDPECIYIKKWIPELETVSISTIHQWYKQTSSYKKYPAPIVDHAEQAIIAKNMYKYAK